MLNLFYVRLQRRQQWKTNKQVRFPVAMGDKAIAIPSSCIRGYLHIKKYGTQASNTCTNWIAYGNMPTMTIDILPASRWNTCQKVERRTIFVHWNVVLSSAEYFQYNPHFLLRFTSGLQVSLQYPHHLSVGCMPLYGTWRYIDKDNLPCRLVKLSNSAKILLDQHTRTCYNQTFHILKLLKLRSC